MDAFTDKGLFWTPDLPDHKVPGELTFDSSGLWLNLQAGLGSRNIVGQMNTNSIKTIYGRCRKGVVYTLYDTLTARSELHSSFTVESTAKPRLCLKGVHVELEKLEVLEMNLKLDHLHEWYGQYQIRDHSNFDDLIRHQIGFTFEATEPLTVQLPIGTISFNCGYSTEHTSQSSSITVDTAMHCTLTSPLSMKEVFSLASCFADFIAFASCFPVKLRGLTIRTPNMVRINKSIAVFHSYPHEPVKARNAQQMLFSYFEVHDHFIEILRMWHKRYFELKVVHNLYFGMAEKDDLYSQSHLLTLVQALEAYYANTEDTRIIDAEQYEMLLSQLTNIIKQVPDQSFRDSLGVRLKFGNELSLRKRLINLVDKHQPYSKYGIKDTKQFASLISDSRNYYTHYSSDLADKACRGSDLINISRKLSWLITVCLLSEMPVPSELLDRIIKKSVVLAKFHPVRGLVDPD